MGDLEVAAKGSCEHAWRLSLHPATPHLVVVYCARCPAILDDVWPGAIDFVHMQMPNFSVADGEHTAAVPVDMAVDVFLRDQMVIKNGQISRVKEIRTTPRQQAIEEGPRNA